MHLTNTAASGKVRTMGNPTTKPKKTSPHDDLTLMSAMKRFDTDDKARAFLEAQRWPHGPYCPHCGNGAAETIHRIAENPEAKVRAGLLRCNECGKQFTVTVGTIFEDSHIPLRKWMIAFYRMSASKTQVSALQLQRELELGSYRTAWFMCHRIRFAMAETDPTNGGQDKLSGTVEVDESWFGGSATNAHGKRIPHKSVVAALVERDGRVRTEIIGSVVRDTMDGLLAKHVEPSAIVNTDESGAYENVRKNFAAHDTVNHSAKKEYSRKDKTTGRRASTNRVEGVFSGFKRSIDGTHHAVGHDYLGMYLEELSFKYNSRDVSDGARTVEALTKVEGKRLSLRPMKSVAVIGEGERP